MSNTLTKSMSNDKCGTDELHERLREFTPGKQRQFIMGKTQWLEITYECSEVHFSPFTNRIILILKKTIGQLKETNVPTCAHVF